MEKEGFFDSTRLAARHRLSCAGFGYHSLKNSMHDGNCDHYLLFEFWAIFKNVQNDPETKLPFLNEYRTGPKNTII
jgi:hypothetical protein